MSSSLLLSAQKLHLGFLKKAINILSSWTAVIFSRRTPLRGVFWILKLSFNYLRIVLFFISPLFTFSIFPVSPLFCVYPTCSSFLLCFIVPPLLAYYQILPSFLDICSYATWRDYKATNTPVLGLLSSGLKRRVFWQKDTNFAKEPEEYICAFTLKN